MIKAGLKRGAAALLSVSMLLGYSQLDAGSIKVYAGTDLTPSLSAYATKKQLENSFTPSADGTAENVGKIYFGKDEDGNKQEWYVLGSDSNAEESENTAIFAASNMIYYHENKTKDKDIHSVKFEDDYYKDKGYDEDTMGTYEENAPSMVSPDHYGASDIRTVLRAMAGEDGTVSTNINTSRFIDDSNDTKLFTYTEKNLLQATAVRTDDFRGDGRDVYKDESDYYTTSDKLYLGAWDYNGKYANYPWAAGQDDTKFYIGSEDNKKVLAMNTYWASSKSGYKDNEFWLRSPCSNVHGYSLFARPGRNTYRIIGYIVNIDNKEPGVRPASNLKLTDVFFASSVAASTDAVEKAASITAGSAMSLRLNGKNKNIGTVRLNGDNIIATRGLTGKTVTLIVQGKSQDVDTWQDIDWYYSKTIIKDTIINEDTIKNKVNNTTSVYGEGIDLDQCKIWLEITDDDGMLYAVDTTHEHNYDGAVWENEDPTYHWKLCTPSNACPDEDKEKDFVDFHTFNEKGYCTVCDYNANGNWGLATAADATCVAGGHKDYWIYKVDGKFTMYRFTGKTTPFGLKILESFTDLSLIQTGKDPNNHIKERVYENNNNSLTHLVLCAGCGASLGTASHNFNGNKCTDCGYSKSNDSNNGGSSSGSSSSSNINTSWIKDTKGWKFRNSDGTLTQGTTVTDADGNKVEKVLWQKAGNGYFAFGSDGYLVTGWIYDKLDDKWYYCDENRGKLYGWFLSPQDSYWYYLSPSTGEALTGWQSINGKSYYFAGLPSAPTYSYDAATGFWIYSNIQGIRPFGSMYASTVTPDNYTVDASGAWVH